MLPPTAAPRSLVASAMLAVLLGGGVGCGGDDAPTFPGFAGTPEPVISSGRAGVPILPVDPSILVDDEGYHLFYSTFFCLGANGYEYSWNPADPDGCNLDAPLTAIAYAFSSDRGLTWEFRRTPAVTPGASGFDAFRVETAAAFRRGDTLYVAYSADGDRNGAPFLGRYQIGLASLTLGGQSIRTALIGGGRVFARRPTPLLAYDLRAGRFDNNVQEPSVVAGPDGIDLYYIGLGLELPDQPIDAPGQTVRSIGLGRARLDDALQVVARSESPVLNGVNITEVRYFDGAYHLLATTLGGGELHRNEALAYARSADGATWTPPNVILAPGAVPGFDDWGLMAPTTAVERERVVLFFTAFGSIEGACPTNGSDARFGIAAAGGTRCVFPTVGRATSTRPDLALGAWTTVPSER